MVMEVSAIQYFTIDNFVDMLQNGSLKYCEPHIYIRNGIKEDNVERKMLALTFYDGDHKFIRVEDPLKVYKRDETDTLYVISGVHRTEALKRLFLNAAQKSELLDFYPIPIQVVTNATDNELRVLQLSTNENTEPHTPVELMKVAIQMESEFLDLPEVQKLSEKKRAAKVNELLVQNLKFSIQYIKKLIALGKSPKPLQDLIEAKHISVESANQLRQRLESSKPNPTEEDYKEVCQELFQTASLEQGKINDSLPEDEQQPVAIAPRLVSSYFEQKEAEEKALNLQEETADSTEGTKTDTTEIEETNGKKSSDKDKDKIETVISLDEVRESFELLISRWDSIDLEALNSDDDFHQKRVSELCQKLPAMFQFMFSILSPSEGVEFFKEYVPAFSNLLTTVYNKGFDENVSGSIPTRLKDNDWSNRDMKTKVSALDKQVRSLSALLNPEESEKETKKTEGTEKAKPKNEIETIELDPEFTATVSTLPL